MKKVLIISVLAALSAGLISCGKPRRGTGSTYMPDMYYSRAYETYAALDTSVFTSKRTEAGGKVYYDRLPVAGTVARGDMAAYPYKNDSMGYINSASVKNPLDLASIDMKEAERLYLVNCGICHGAKLDGNGPLYNDGNGPYAAAPKNLVSDPAMVAMAEGTMFHSVTYGIRAMGSYASQLSTKQRWMVIAYVKSKQAKPAAVTTAKTDSAAAK
jgi:mono/diheme cytochrome c family protein